MKDQTTTVAKLIALAAKFRDERNWNNLHSSRNLAASIAIEAAELLEHWQWDETDKQVSVSDIRQELADVVIYCLYLADENKIDLSDAIEKKLKKAAKKYPAEVFKNHSLGSAKYWEVKAAHRGKPSPD